MSLQDNYSEGYVPKSPFLQKTVCQKRHQSRQAHDLSFRNTLETEPAARKV